MPAQIDAQANAFDLARSAAYGLLAEGCNFPDDARWGRLTDRSRWLHWPEILAEAGDDVRMTLRRVQETLFSPDPGRGGETLDSVQSTYVRVFGHTAKGPCPMYELEYGAGEIFQRSSDLSDLRGFYEAFGLELSGEGHERPDHVAVELEFLAIMASKEAHAAAVGDADGIAILREAHGRFLEDHLAVWLPAFARRLADTVPGTFYGALAEFARAFLETECRRYDVQAGPATLEIRPGSEKDETLQACAVEDFGGACPMHPEEA
jgi:DMSO reductase family type II enzyme chaperone